MKKLLVLIMSLFVLVGCSDGHASISDPNEAIFSVGDVNVTKGEVYSSLISQKGTYEVINEVNNAILNAEVEVSEDMQKEANETVETLQGLYGDYFDTLLSSYGFKDADDYKTRGIIPSLQSSELYKKYVEENWNTLVKEQNPKKAIVLKFEDATKANDAKAALDNGEDVTAVASDFESSTSAASSIITNDSSYSSDVLAAINSATTSDYALIASVDGYSYIISVTDSDVNNFKDEVVEQLAATEDIQNATFSYYVKKHNFKVYDREIYDSIAESYPEYVD